MFVTEFDWMTEGARLVFAMEFCSTVFVDTLPEGTVGYIHQFL